jgi:hypothetical protein
MEELVTKIRIRKGLKVCIFEYYCDNKLNILQPEVPPLDTYYDKL